MGKRVWEEKNALERAKPDGAGEKAMGKTAICADKLTRQEKILTASIKYFSVNTKNGMPMRPMNYNLRQKSMGDQSCFHFATYAEGRMEIVSGWNLIRKKRFKWSTHVQG